MDHSLLGSSLSMGLSLQEYWSGLPFPPPGDLPNSGIEPVSLMSPAWQVGSLPLAPPGKPLFKGLETSQAFLNEASPHTSVCRSWGRLLQIDLGAQKGVRWEDVLETQNKVNWWQTSKSLEGTSPGQTAPCQALWDMQDPQRWGEAGNGIRLKEALFLSWCVGLAHRLLSFLLDIFHCAQRGGGGYWSHKEGPQGSAQEPTPGNPSYFCCPLFSHESWLATRNPGPPQPTLGTLCSSTNFLVSLQESWPRNAPQ